MRQTYSACPGHDPSPTTWRAVIQPGYRLHLSTRDQRTAWPGARSDDHTAVADEGRGQPVCAYGDAADVFAGVGTCDVEQSSLCVPTFRPPAQGLRSGSPDLLVGVFVGDLEDGGRDDVLCKWGASQRRAEPLRPRLVAGPRLRARPSSEAAPCAPPDP